MKVLIYPKPNVINLIVVFVFTFQSLYAQNWINVKHCGGMQSDIGSKIRNDTLGNIYFSGKVEGTAYFDTIQAWCGNPGDSFLAKYDPNMNPVWVKFGHGGYPPNYYNYASDLVVDHEENVIVVGDYSGTTYFDSIKINPIGGNTDIFLAKYNNDGNCLWVKTAGGNGEEEISSVTIDQQDYLYITGYIGYTATFGSISVINNTSHAVSYIAKYSPSGSCIWVKTLTGTDDNFINAVEFRNSEIFVTGYFYGEITVGAFTLSGGNLPNIFTAKFDTSGDCQWAKTVQGMGKSYSYAITTDENKNCFITGTFKGTVIFDSTAVNNDSFWDIFITKYDVNGQVQWVRQANTTLGDAYIIGSKGMEIKSTSTGDLYFTGRFCGTLNFGNYFLTATGWEDLFIAKFNTSGECLGVSQGTNSIGNGIAFAPDGNLIICGSMKDTAVFGSLSAVSYGDQDVLLAKMTDITGIESRQIRVQDELLIYANPNEGICNITIPDEFTDEKNLTLRIYDSKGKLIQSAPIEINENRISLNISAQARGIYQAILTNGKKSYSGKIVFTNK